MSKRAVDDLFGDEPSAKVSGKVSDKSSGKASKKTEKQGDYSAKDIEVLEGLEPVRRRPGMYVGGTDERALHHLPAEVWDNSMDEAVAGYARKITITLHSFDRITIADDGRGIPVDPHPKFKNKSALEVILTTLHSGGKFSNKSYATAGGLHGVGISVVNALSSDMVINVTRDGYEWQQKFSRGVPQGKLEKGKKVARGSGTSVTFTPDPEIFGKLQFKPAQLFRMAKAKAYLFKGVKIHWRCEVPLAKDDETPAEAELHFPAGLEDYLSHSLGQRPVIGGRVFAGAAELEDPQGRIEWAIAWPDDEEGFQHSYCNTIPTPLGGTHEAGLRSGLLKSIKAQADRLGFKKASQLTADDVLQGACVLLSAFIPDPQFQGQTKEKLVTASATKLVETLIKDHCELWLGQNKKSSEILIQSFIDRLDARLRAKQQKETARKSATRRLRLPGKLADCSKRDAEGTEIFIVEGDSAGGSAKQARNRETQAILPLRGKILNVASATAEKLAQNQELQDLMQALGCGMGSQFKLDHLRYERVVIMTDADVDGAHIAALLMTFFYQQTPELVEKGHLFLAVPPLYRISFGGQTHYARDDAHRDEILKGTKANQKIETSRFKGLGEMSASQLKETTMDPKTRQMIQLQLPARHDATEADLYVETRKLVDTLMGKKPELRLAYIQDHASFIDELDL